MGIIKMFRRDVKKQFNNNKYNILTQKGLMARSHMARAPFQKMFVGTCALYLIGLNYTKRYFTMPHAHKDSSHPMLFSTGELHPYEQQPKSAGGMPMYTKHEKVK